MTNHITIDPDGRLTRERNDQLIKVKILKIGI